MTATDLGRSGPPSELRSLRRRWTGLATATPPTLTIHLLASYTADPLVPYLGVRLHDADLSAGLSVAPYNQIMQQCLDDASATGRLRPDVLIVAPRFEELQAAAYADVALCAEIAERAAERWRCFLIFLLPAIPAERRYGTGDSSRRDGTAAITTAIRERVRHSLSGLSHVHLIDVDEVIGSLGIGRALRPALYAHAKIPYSEEVFDLIGEQVATVLRLRYRGGHQAVMLDADGIAPDGSSSELGALAECLDALLRAGIRLAIQSSQDADVIWTRLGHGLAEIAGDPRVRWQIGPLPAAEQLTRLSSELRVVPSQVALLTADRALAAQAAAAGHPVFVLGEAPELWPYELTAAGLLDVLPGPAGAAKSTAAGAEPGPAEPGPGVRPANLADFVAGLGVSVTFRDLDTELDDAAREMVDRAHDFTLGRPYPAGGAGLAFAAEVSDRLGDYGTGAVVSMRIDGPVCQVETFSLSCPVLGRCVEDTVLDQIVARATDAGCSEVTFEFTPTGRNAITAEFLRSAMDVARAAPSRRPVRIRVREMEPQS